MHKPYRSLVTWPYNCFSLSVSPSLFQLLSLPWPCARQGKGPWENSTPLFPPTGVPSSGLGAGRDIQERGDSLLPSGPWTLHEMQTAHDQAGPGLYSNLRNITKTLGKEEMKKSQRERWILRDGWSWTAAGGLFQMGNAEAQSGQALEEAALARQRRTLRREGRTQVGSRPPACWARAPPPSSSTGSAHASRRPCGGQAASSSMVQVDSPAGRSSARLSNVQDPRRRQPPFPLS